MLHEQDKPVLMLSQVRDWQHRLGEIAVRVRGLQEEASELTRKLEAVKTLLGGLPDQEGDVESDNQDQDEEVFSNVVLRAVGALPGAPKPAEIKRWIVQHSSVASAVDKANRPYFYTVLMRHAQTGRLIKEGDGYRLPTSSAQAETGAGDPGSL